jgi:TRAP-type C4-dicarboxylate transport system substrate-binding protein
LGAIAMGIGAGGVSATADAADMMDMKIAFFPSPKHPLWENMMMPFANKLEGANVGFKFQHFPGSQIGGAPPGAFKRVVNGISDVELHLPGYTSTVFPRTLVMEIPMQWDTPSEATAAAWRIMDKHFAGEYDRVKLLALWGTDVPVVMTNKPVRTPADLAGLKLRTPSANQALIIKGLGAIPVAMPMNETYNAIQKGVVDGAIVGISMVKSFKLEEVVSNFIIDLPMGYSPIIIAMNGKKYEAMSPEQKAAVDRNSGLRYSMDGAQSYERERIEGIQIVNKREGSSITRLTKEEKQLWIEKLEAVSDEWVNEFEKQGIPYRQILTDYLSKTS